MAPVISDYNFAGTLFFKTYADSHGPVEAIPANDPNFNTKSIDVNVSQSGSTHTLNRFESQVGITAVILKVGNQSFAFDYALAPGFTFDGGRFQLQTSRA